MFLLSLFWDSTITDWLLILVTGAGVLGTVLAGAGALLVGAMTYRVNRQTQTLQNQLHQQQLHDRREQRLREFGWAYADWENRQRANDEMRYLAESSFERLQNMQAAVQIQEWKHPDAESTYSFVQIGEGDAETVGFEDVSLPYPKSWTRVYGDEFPTLTNQDVIVAVLNDHTFPANGTLVKLTWSEADLEMSEVMGEPFRGSRQLEQLIYIPPTIFEPAPVFVPTGD